MVRHGIMTLGPTGTGKSCCITVLMKALSDLGEPHKEIRSLIYLIILAIPDLSIRVARQSLNMLPQ